MLDPVPPADSTEIANDLVGHTVEEVERQLILTTLAHHGGNRTWAARALGISIRTLRNKISGYVACGIAVPEPAPRGSVEGTLS